MLIWIPDFIGADADEILFIINRNIDSHWLCRINEPPSYVGEGIGERSSLDWCPLTMRVGRRVGK